LRISFVIRSNTREGTFCQYNLQRFGFFVEFPLPSSTRAVITVSACESDVLLSPRLRSSYHRAVPALIETTNLTRSYRLGKKTLTVLEGVNLSIQRGEKIFLCGPSGAGKTTLLYTLAGLERPQAGQVVIDGIDLYSLSRAEQSRFRNQRIGYIFQNYHLLPELTALENVMVPGAIAGKNHRDQALAALTKVGLADRADHLPAELSGGEQQRVAIARAIVNEPDILFADEPTGNLDSRNSIAIMNLLLQLVSEKRTTLIVVTHDSGLATQGDRILTIKDGVIA